ncbi:MAG: hypothetical protein GY699_12470 [Desulfobacteraceae bacterium]|nr:hypothetical protein [Desulfobacteraceae bacterium]
MTPLPERWCLVTLATGTLAGIRTGEGDEFGMKYWKKKLYFVLIRFSTFR